jgi:hypothetical protein
MGKITIDQTKKDLYSNPFPYKSLEFTSGLDKVPIDYKPKLIEFSENIKNYIKEHEINPDSMTKSALTQNMNELVEKIPWNEPFERIGPIRKNDIGDKLGRITKVVLMISKTDADAKNILKPLESITESIFKEKIDELVTDIYKPPLKIDVG